MSLDHLAQDEVVALRFDEPAAAEDLARWCGGGLVGDTLTVPAPHGRLAVAHPGDWVVLLPDGGFDVMTHRDFSLRYGPFADA